MEAANNSLHLLLATLIILRLELLRPHEMIKFKLRAGSVFRIY
jgi:hypothetical protein